MSMNEVGVGVDALPDTMFKQTTKKNQSKKKSSPNDI
jgi:hypothetical protein